MPSLYIVLPALVIALILILLVGRRSPVDVSRWPFYAKQLLTEPEQVLYHRLVEALPDFIVLSQVQLSQILGVEKGARFHEWNNRINRMSVDFVVLNKGFKPLVVLELDDSTHQRPDRVKADAKKDKALTDAGLPIIRLPVSPMPTGDDVAQKIALVLGDGKR